MGQIKPTTCNGCSRINEKCVIESKLVQDARITFLMESPSFPSVASGIPASGKSGTVLKMLANSIESTLTDGLSSMPYNLAYAVGAMGKIKQKVVVQCADIWKSQWSAKFGSQEGTHVVIAFGLPALKSLGLNARKALDARGKFMEANINGKKVFVVPTLSLATAYAKPGLVGVIQQDMLKAYKAAYQGFIPLPKTIEELSKNYVFPKTLDEVKNLCDQIISYTDAVKQPDPDKWVITVDTETNTLKPYRKEAKVLMVSIAWDAGKSTAILLDHAENTWYDPKNAWTHVARVLTCPKPKALHNAKFDLQFLEKVYGYPVNNVVWDTMTGEHFLSEDQKGVYGLKALASIYEPTYEGYEQTLHDALRQGEEAAPTEEDVLKEAADLAEIEGNSGTVSWMEDNFAEDHVEGLSAEEEANNLLRGEPDFPVNAAESDKEEYRKQRDAWFAADVSDDSKARGSAMRKWKKVCKTLTLSEPTPIQMKKMDVGFEKIAAADLLPYAAVDTDVTRLIMRAQYRKLNKTGQMPAAKQLMETIYLPASRTLGNLEFRGVKINQELARDYDNQLTYLIDDAQAKIWLAAGENFNLNAPKQLSAIFTKLGFLSVKKTAKGAESTAKDVLADHQLFLIKNGADAKKLEFIEALMLYRAATKMKSSFLKRLREYSALDGKIHTSFHLVGTSTGRLSSSKLNLQNLPLYMCRVTRPRIDGQDPDVVHEGFNVKSLLIPDNDDEVIFNLDIKAAEIRVCCYYSNDAELIKAVTDGLDVHTYFLTRIKHQELKGVEVEAKYKEYKALVDSGDIEINKFRLAVKRVVFGTLYGAGPTKIAAQINSTREYAKELIEGFFAAFPGIRAYVTSTKAEVNANKEVSNIFGRVRRFPMVTVNSELRSAAEREAVNFKIQATSSDLVVSQLCEIDEHIHEIQGEVRLTVHDSIAGVIKKNRVGEMKAFFDKWLVDRVKERFPWLPVPFSYDLEVGKSYGEHEKVKVWLSKCAPSVS